MMRTPGALSILSHLSTNTPSQWGTVRPPFRTVLPAASEVQDSLVMMQKRLMLGFPVTIFYFAQWLPPTLVCHVTCAQTSTTGSLDQNLRSPSLNCPSFEDRTGFWVMEFLSTHPAEFPFQLSDGPSLTAPNPLNFLEPWSRLSLALTVLVSAFSIMQTLFCIHSQNRERCVPIPFSVFGPCKHRVCRQLREYSLQPLRVVQVLDLVWP